MAHFEKVLTGNSSRIVRPSNGVQAQELQYDKERRLALQQQAELVRRAQAPTENDPLQSFDSSMTREQVRSQFLKLVQRSRESVFA